MQTWKRSAMMAGMALASTSALANAQAPPVTPPAAATPVQNPGAELMDKKTGDLPGPIDSLSDVQDTGRMLFKMADTNNDGQISQKEAIDAGNLMVGGFFFRADANGDGVLSQDEAKQARESIFRQQPLLKYVVEKGQYEAKKTGTNTVSDPAQMLGNMLDTNNDKQLQATEVRTAVTSAVQGAFALADTNRDNQLSPSEINSAIIGVARTAAQSAFQTADADKNGSLSKAEYDKAIIEPANMVFGILDGNNDGQLSPEELQQASKIVGNQLKMLVVPEPANSARNLIRTGTAPDQVAPVPGSPARR